MEIPLVSGKAPAFARQGVSVPGASRFGAASRVSSSKEPSAEQVALQSNEALSASRAAFAGRGYLDDLGSYLKDLGGQVKTLNSRLSKGLLSATQEQALRDELSSLADRFDQLRRDDRFTTARSLLDPAAGGSGSSATLLGERFNNLLASGNTAYQSSLRSALDGLSNLTLGDSGAGDRLIQLGQMIENALSGSGPEAGVASTSSAKQQMREPLALQDEESSYQLSSGLSLTLRSLDAKSMIQAAVSGLDREFASQLILEAPKEKKEKQKEKSEDDRGRREAQAGGVILE